MDQNPGEMNRFELPERDDWIEFEILSAWRKSDRGEETLEVAGAARCDRDHDQQGPLHRSAVALRRFHIVCSVARRQVVTARTDADFQPRQIGADRSGQW